LTRVSGFIFEPDGELILLGHSDAGPGIHIDDLTVSLRNSYGRQPSQPIGCSIEPQHHETDPWRIQRTKLFGMPACRMAARHVRVDYDLKWATAGIREAAPTIPSLFTLERNQLELGENPDEGEQSVESVHRFWFYPAYDPPPRFLSDEGACLIERPIAVQLMTEQALFDAKRRNVGAAPAPPPVQEFAKLVTGALLRGEYAVELVQDFRLVELAKLLAFQGIPADSLPYLLHEHALEPADVPEFVGGVRREEAGEIVYENRVTDKPTAGGVLLRSRESVRSYRINLRGGIDADARVAPDDFTMATDGRLAFLRRVVRQSRPSKGALVWPVRF
jgi:hypothetical protein